MLLLLLSLLILFLIYDRIVFIKKKHYKSSILILAIPGS